ncbi:MAG: glycoside hydrolase family 2 TIM barrel-domain containing protein [Pygmaiobacter sp.]|nr:glycoside hydrolase family 2 TIM barrel-domain containing protein [Pygmaiobacter sp.]
MLREKLNTAWQFAKGTPSMMSAFTGGETFETVHLPHDAMVHEDRKKDTQNGAQTGFWPGGAYTYIKTIAAPQGWQDKTVLLEFEGVYETAMVYINGVLAKTNLYGYAGFYVTLDAYLNYGADNEIKVVVNNAAEKNTRWYSGSGIYRNVNLLVGNRIYICEDGVKINTPLADTKHSIVEIATAVQNLQRRKERITVKTTLSYQGTVVGTDTSVVTMFNRAQETVRQRMDLEDAKLWNVDTPELYDCLVQIYAGDELLDEAKEHFGIRTLTLDAQHGLCINGMETKLRGACIHHDNGLIGAVTLEAAEARRCHQLKEAGFNSIRSAHHPMSKAMLDACDRYGMLVMDELSDIWTRHKNPNDYALHFAENLEQEVDRMVEKDYNHPCVVLYSTGNEIPEIGTPSGAQINRKICNRFRALDATRYTTNAINGMLALGKNMGEVIQDLMKNQPPKQESAGSEEGAGALNSMMALMKGPMADAMACHPRMTEILEEASQAMDITGLNYLTGRHELEKQLHPNKCVLGTETFPGDIVRLWDIVERNPHVLGDYTWTGYDYLGEAGCGIFYYDGTQNFNGVYPDRLAYIGDINLIGSRRPISYLREIVFGLRKAPYIAVEKVDKYGLPHSWTAWMDKDNIASWTWPGYEGKPAKLDVFSADEEVELFLNGTSLGRRSAGKANGFRACYALTYQPGELVAVGYTGGRETGRQVLQTADSVVQMAADAPATLKADGEDLAFITVRLKDAQGRENTFAQKEITVTVEGAGTLQGFGNADPRAIGSYDSPVWQSYEGEVMAVVRAGTKAGSLQVKFAAQGLPDEIVTLAVE